VEVAFHADGVELSGYLANPPTTPTEPPAVVLCHGFPTDELGAAAIGVTMPMLADRIANEGWRALAFTFRGCGRSTGNFSLGGWLDDLTAAIAWLVDVEPTRGVWLAGFGTGGALSVCAGARHQEVVGVASLCAPADFDDWANHPRRLLQHARDIRAISDADFPVVPEAWIRELRDIRPVSEVARLAPRPLLLVHGSEDQSVPSFDARVVSDAHGSAELRIVSGAGHDLRHDPRAVAILLGWLDRERHRTE
jgi:uncharacterized protein